MPAATSKASDAATAGPPAVETRPRDRLMDLIVEYLDIAFVREPKEHRSARLQPGAQPAKGAQ